MINARALLILSGLFAFFIMIGIRLFNIQISNHEKYKYLAEKQQYRSEKILPLRGVIKDRDGETLAYSKREISFFVDTRMMNERRINQIVSKFSKVFNKSEKYYRSLIKSSNRNVKIEGPVSEGEAGELKTFVVDGLFSEEVSKRVYPYKSLAAHVLGYVDSDGRGCDGIENSYNKVLKGDYGRRLLERDVRGRTVSVIDDFTQPAKDGSSVVLTINRTYQNALEEGLSSGLEEFDAESAVGIIMDPNTGEILALSSVPGFDPERYNKTSNDVRRNIALTDTYEPGSTLKAVVMASLLNEGLVREEEKVNTENGTYKVHGVRIKDTHRHPKLTVREVLEQSSNIGMSKLVERIDDDVFYKYLRNFGFGNVTNIDLPGETDGYLKKPNSYSKISKYFLSFGYEMSATPVQMVTAFSALVNGGTLYQPYIVKEVKNSDGQIIESFESKKIRNVISSSTSAEIKNLMVGVVEKGTAKLARLDNVIAGGKTGTSKKIVNNEYSKKHYNSSFIGFFPADEPKVVCFVLVNSPKNAKYGGTVAAPIFKTVAEKLIDADISLIPADAPKIKRDDLFEEFMADLQEENEEPLLVTSDLGEDDFEEVANITNSVTLGYMPDLQNKSMREAIAELTNIGIKYKIKGSGNIISQSIKPGQKINPGDVCALECSTKNINSSIKLN